MRTQRNSASVFVAKSIAALALLLSCSLAQAVSVGLDVLVGGVWQGSYDESQLGCTNSVNGQGIETASCAGSDFTIGDLQLDNWNMFFDPDPIINGVVGVTNLSGSTQQFTLLFTLPIAPAIPGGTVIGGSVQGGATDNNGNGVTISTPTGSAFYSALIDGSVVQMLYPDPSSYSAAPFNSTTVPNASFGNPIPSQSGPAALSTIGIQIDFLLTAGDSASFTSVFVVEPAVVPVPAAAWLLGSALLGLAGLRSRR